MPVFLVRLAAPAVYQPDHPRVNRPVTELSVNAPDETAARVHVLRVLAGDIRITEVIEVEDKRSLRPPPLEDAPLPTPEAAAGSGMVGNAVLREVTRA